MVNLENIKKSSGTSVFSKSLNHEIPIINFSKWHDLNKELQFIVQVICLVFSALVYSTQLIGSLISFS